MGAWIEMIKCLNGKVAVFVAPHMGAWIEIRRKQMNKQEAIVAPHMGAWIEITDERTKNTVLWSHPTWVRGLK